MNNSGNALPEAGRVACHVVKMYEIEIPRRDLTEDERKDLLEADVHERAYSLVLTEWQFERLRELVDHASNW
jgi:hypothetical protein